MWRFSLPLRTAYSSSLLCQRTCLPLSTPLGGSIASFSTFDEGKPKKKVVSGYESAVPKWKKDRADKFKQKMAGGGDRRGRSNDKFKGSSFGKDSNDRGGKQQFKSFDNSSRSSSPFRTNKFKDNDKKPWSKFSNDKSRFSNEKPKFSNDKPKYSNDKPKYSNDKPKYSNDKHDQQDSKRGSKEYSKGKASGDFTRGSKQQFKSEPKVVEAPKSIHEIQAEREAAWSHMRKIRVLTPGIHGSATSPSAAPSTPSPFKPFKATAVDTLKGDGISTDRRAQRQLNKKNRVFDNLQAPAQDIVEPLHTFEEPDSPRGVKPRGLNVAVIGRPNAGKSSLMNSLLGFNVSAVSAKYNTTRDRVLGVLTQGDAQIAFYDTPGLVNLKDSHTFVRSLAITASETMPSVDMSLLVVDAVKRLDEQALEALKNIAISSAKEAAPIMLVMNKMDLVGPTERPHVAKRVQVLSDMIEEAFTTYGPKEDDEFDEFDEVDNDEDDEDDDDDDDDYEEFDSDDFEDFEDDMSELELDPTKYLRDNCIKLSSFKDKDVAKLRKELLALAVDRPWMFHSRMKSDRSDLDLVTEIIREKLYRRFNQELPYQVTNLIILPCHR
ncbi:hypothetical protein DYB36_009248 [Aphanomyces astaci]|uniref:G domain-containing protein n=1 Tax=Aphanomyces astaci TaxID=112090 RepID=A0A397A0I6_APHAT|nr:hypothetical protein DYB36_009248 [Aphanomyces astaci]